MNLNTPVDHIRKNFLDETKYRTDNQNQLQISTIIYFKLSELWYFAYIKPFLRLKQKSYSYDAILFLILVKMNQHLKFELVSPIKQQWLKQAKKIFSAAM